MSYYGTVEKVKQQTGIRPSDIGIELEEDGLSVDTRLDAIIESWLEEAKDFIDEDRNRDYAKEVADGKREKVPAGIVNIAVRLASNMAALAILRRETPIVKHDDYDIKMSTDKIFTDAIKHDLARYPFKHEIRMMRIKKKDPEDED